MTRAVPALLALLLVCSLPAVATVAAAPLPTDQVASQTLSDESSPSALTAGAATAPARMLRGSSYDTTNRLSAGDSSTASYVAPGPDFATSAGTSGDSLRTDFEAYRAEHEWDRKTTDEREAALRDAKARLDGRIDALDEREQNAVQAVANGERSVADGTRTLVRTSEEAAALSDALDALEELERGVPGYDMATSSDKRYLDSHRSAVRDELRMRMAGRSTSPSASVTLLETSSDGAVLSTLSNGDYLREAMRFDNRDPDSPNELSSDEEVLNRRNALYPWAFDEGSDTSVSYNGHPDRNLFRVGVTTLHGDLNAYIDGATTDVFSETQELQVADLPSDRVEETWQSDSLVVSMNVTPAQGPAEFSVVDSETGDPVDAEVRIDDRYLGTTGDDGSLWVLPPSGRVNFSISDGDRTVNGSVGLASTPAF